jgi:uncharacterized protein
MLGCASGPLSSCVGNGKASPDQVLVNGSCRAVKIFFFLILGAFFLGNFLWWFLTDRALRKAQASRYWRGALALWLIVLSVGLATWVGGRWASIDFQWPLGWIAVIYIWHLLILPVLLVGGIMGVTADWLWHCFQRRDARPRATVDHGRRHFLQSLVYLPPSVAGVAAGIGLQQLHDFRVRRIEVPLRNLPPELEGFTIAHISDVHVGRFTQGKTLQKIVEVTNALKSDLVVLTGDIVNDSLQVLPAAVEMMQKLEARYGVYLCEGNHDLIEDGEAFRQRVKAAGCRLLVNEGETLQIKGQPLRVIGTRWTGGMQGEPRTGHDEASYFRLVKKEISEVMEEGAFPIVLTHHPHAWLAAREAGARLTLAGHTHGGQLMLNSQRGFGPLMFRYWSGLYNHDGRALVVSNGVGNWFPLRINAPAEILHLVLRSAVV